MPDSSQSRNSTPPENPIMRPSFHTRVLAFLGLYSVPHAMSSDRYRERLEKVARIPNHEPVNDATNQTPWTCQTPCEHDVPTGEFSAHHFKRYPLGMPEDAMRRQAWYDNVNWKDRMRAVTSRADMLNAAIQFACSHGYQNDRLEWLVTWNEGDEAADNELREWINGPGKAVLGEAVARRVGLPPVSPTMGCLGPEPAPVQPTPGSGTPYTYKGEPPTVPVHPAQVMDEAEKYGWEKYPNDSVMRNLVIQRKREELRLNAPIGPTARWQPKS